MARTIKISELSMAEKLPGPNEMVVPIYITTNDGDPAEPIRRCTIGDLATAVTNDVMKSAKVEMRITGEGIIFQRLED